jgi:hypothetical protein
MKRRILAFALLVTGAVAVTAGFAAAAPAGKLDAQVIGNVTIDPSDPTVASFAARYICEGGEGAHVWASVKQAGSGLPEQWLTEEGSGGRAMAEGAWSHSHANAVTCDGQWHVGTFTVDQLEWGGGELQQGQGWVQFCVIPAGGDPETGPITWSMRFAAVK